LPDDARRDIGSASCGNRNNELDRARRILRKRGTGGERDGEKDERAWELGCHTGLDTGNRK
jgi:hypothetical protein